RKTLIKNSADLPMAFGKILPDEIKLGLGLVVVKLQYILDELCSARRLGHARLPGKMKRAQHYARGIRVQLFAKNAQRRVIRSAYQHERSRRPSWPPAARLGRPSHDRQGERLRWTQHQHSC